MIINLAVLIAFASIISGAFTWVLVWAINRFSEDNEEQP